MADRSAFPSAAASIHLDYWPIAQLDPALYQKPSYYFGGNGNDNTPRTVHTPLTNLDLPLDDLKPSADQDGASDHFSPIPMTRLASHSTPTGHHHILPSSNQPRLSTNHERLGKREFHHVDMEHSHSYTYGSISTSHDTTHVDNVRVFEPADFCFKLSRDAARKKQRLDDGSRGESSLSPAQVHPTSLVSPNSGTGVTTTSRLSPPDSSFSSTGSEGMSRECSLTSASTVTTDTHDMMRVESSFSSGSPFYPIESSFVASTQHMIGTPTSSSAMVGVVDDCANHHLLGSMGYGFGDENFSFSVPAFSGKECHEAFRLEEMSRTCSADSNSLSESSGIKASERRRKHIANARQSIAPKCLPKRLPTTTAKPANSSPPKARHSTAATSTANSKPKQLISKTPYVRPTHAKLHCDQCDEFPLGFRGEHELRRHHDRAHARRRRVWICVDPMMAEESTSPHALPKGIKSEDHAPRPTKPLSSCKQCKQRKTYNVYYNAAAHLRRAHFCPRKRGRRAKGEDVRERRAGKAGGDWPKIEWLKREGWLKEVIVDGSQREPMDGEADEDELSTPAGHLEKVETESAQMHPHDPAPYLPSQHEAFAPQSLGFQPPAYDMAYTYDSHPAMQTMHWPQHPAAGYTAPMMQHTVSAPATYPALAYHGQW